MPITAGQVQQPGMTSTAPSIMAGPAANAGMGAQPSGAGDAMAPLVQALLKAKLQQKLAGQLPGTTPMPAVPAMPAGAAPNYFSPQQAAANAPPLNLGGVPPGVPGQQ